MKEIKLAILGGGSSYTPELLDGVAKRYLEGEFHAKEIVMVDIPEGRDRMETVASFARRMLSKRGMPCSLTTTVNRREAFDGASFVISQVRVGGMLSRRKDEHIPLKHGVIGQETTGAGGFANALRTIPVSSSSPERCRTGVPMPGSSTSRTPRDSSPRPSYVTPTQKHSGCATYPSG
jgi:6-phospho-beta-glucosidase